MAIYTIIHEKTFLGNKVNKLFSNILSYDLGRDDCKLRYELRYVDPNRESVAIPDTIITSNVWQVPHEVLSNWSGSNAYLVEKLCEMLDFTPIEHSAHSDLNSGSLSIASVNFKR
jgi:hypothetical protein